MITQAELKELLHFCPDTGIFTNKSDRYLGKKGEVAGSVNNRGYLKISLNGDGYLSHRLAWLYVYGVWPNEIDHINGVKTDNRIENLRNVTRTENQQNAKRRADNKSGFTGVCWDKASSRWVVQIRADGKQIRVGSYPSKIAAVFARKNAEVKYGFHKNHGRVA